MLVSVIQWNLAVAEWLGGRLPEAERAFVSTIALWRAADLVDEAKICPNGPWCYGPGPSGASRAL
jgi:hypothetical protein